MAKYNPTNICGVSGFGFFERLYPLLRAINQTLPLEKRFRVLARTDPRL